MTGFHYKLQPVDTAPVLQSSNSTLCVHKPQRVRVMLISLSARVCRGLRAAQIHNHVDCTHPLHMREHICVRRHASSVATVEYSAPKNQKVRLSRGDGTVITEGCCGVAQSHVFLVEAGIYLFYNIPNLWEWKFFLFVFFKQAFYKLESVPVTSEFVNYLLGANALIGGKRRPVPVNKEFWFLGNLGN